MYTSSYIEFLAKNRLFRLKNVTSKLGEPDLFNITTITTIHTFLTNKKSVHLQQYFVAGLNFPTTAHVSSYINEAIKKDKKQSNHEHFYKIKLFMFDAFDNIDVVIEVNIPGSMEMKGFTLNGQPLPITENDYSRAYYSSVLRSMYNCPYHSSLRLFPYIEQFNVMKNFIKEFIPFTCDHAIKNDLEDYQPIYDEFQDNYNLSLELVANYVLTNQLWNLIPIFKEQLQQYYPIRYQIFNYKVAYAQGQYEQIVIEAASKLLNQDTNNILRIKYKQYQLRSLLRLNRLSESKIMAHSLIREGLMDESTWNDILNKSIEENQDVQFFKLLNTCSSFYLEQTKFKDKLQKAIYPVFIVPGKIQQKERKLSLFPEFCYEFNNQFLQNYSYIRIYRQALKKSSKDQDTFELLQKLESSLETPLLFYEHYLVSFEKIKGWNATMAIRNQCFWLESDFDVNEHCIKKKQNLNKSYRFESSSFIKEEKEEVSSHLKDLSIKKINNEEAEEYFEGMSDSDEEQYKEMAEFQPCSKRIPTKRVNPITITDRHLQNGKILCHYCLQKSFKTLYNLLQLQNDTDKWLSKINLSNTDNISKDKRELIGIILIKKAELHKKLNRFRKAEEALKLVRKCTNNIIVGITACYQLAQLYIEHKYAYDPIYRNIKGVQFYIVELVRLLCAIGIKKFDILPLWAKKMLPFIIKIHGKDLSKMLNGPLQQLVELWMKLAREPQKSQKNIIKK